MEKKLIKNEKLSIAFNLLKNKGLKIKENRLLKKGEEEQVEILEEAIVDFLQDLFENLANEIKKKRKKGHDLFIQELRKNILFSKLKIAISTFEKRDLEKFIERLEKLKIEIEKID